AAADMAVTTEDRSPHDGFLTDARVRPQDGVIDDRMFLDVALPSDDAVGSDAGAGLYDSSFIDEARPLDDGAFLDLGVWRNPGGVMTIVERRGVIAPIHDVAMNLLIFFGRADVNPVSTIDVSDERLLPLDQRRKKTPLDRPRDVFRDAVERVG